MDKKIEYIGGDSTVDENRNAANVIDGGEKIYIVTLENQGIQKGFC